jgi:TolA-binding protein
MARQKRIKKRRLKEDQLVTFTVKASQFIQEYFTQVVAGIVVLVVAVGAILLTAQLRRSAARESEQQLALAMSQYNARDVQGAASAFAAIVDKYGGQTAGEYSRYFLGKSLLAQGKYDEALGAFDGYIGKVGEEGPFYAGAVIGKASSLEGLHNYGAAADLLERLSQTLNEEDPRLAEVLFRAGRDYERSGSRDKARELFGKVAETASGPLKDRATVAIAMLE